MFYCFAVNKSSSMSVGGFTTLFQSGTMTLYPAVTFTYPDSNYVNIWVNSPSYNYNQNFVTCLTAYPTLSMDGNLFDFSITAVG